MKRPTIVIRAISVSALAAGLGLTAPPVLGAVLKGDYLGKSAAEIAGNLETQGYEVEEFEEEGGLIEVEAAIDGVSYEIHVDPATGEIVDFEQDD